MDQVSPRDTPRSTGYGSPRDERFYTPRSVMRGNSGNSDEWGQTPRFETPRYGEYNTPRGTNGYNSQSDGEGQFATPRMFDSSHVHGEHKRSNSINSIRSNGSQNLLAENYHRQNLASHAQLLHSNSSSNPNTARSNGSYETYSPRAHSYSMDGYYNQEQLNLMNPASSAAQSKHPYSASPRDYKGGSGTGNNHTLAQRLPPQYNRHVPPSEAAQYKSSGLGGYQQSKHTIAEEEGDVDGLSEDMAAMGMTEQDVEDFFSFARHGRHEEIEKLLAKGLPVDVRDSFGNTVLIIACQNGNKRVAKAVLRRGANINARNHKGNTPLHYCYHYGYGETLGQYIIEKGGDAEARNNVGKWTYEGI